MLYVYAEAKTALEIGSTKDKDLHQQVIALLLLAV